jgi:tripartite-type tricarboxylate transporter receptor subunit TctC
MLLPGSLQLAGRSAPRPDRRRHEESDVAVQTVSLALPALPIITGKSPRGEETERMQFTGRAMAALAIALMSMPLATVSAAADAQDYPARPIRYIVPFAPGGSADVIGRSVAEQLTRILGKSVVIMNHDGAGTITGVGYAAHAAPDGYTLLQSGDAGSINTASGRSLPYDFMKDLKPVSTLFTGVQVILVNKDSPYHTLQELVRAARAHPGTLKYGSSGVGTSVHLSLEAFNAAAGIEGVHVPYRGVAPDINDLMAGRLDYTLAGASFALPQMQNGNLRALAITSAQRSPFMKDIPTAKEQGVDVVTSSWYGLFVPAATPDAIVATLNGAIRTALQDPGLVKRFESLGGEATYSTPEQARQFVDDDIRKFATLIRKLHITFTN